MRFLFYGGAVLGWVFLIYFAWNDAIPGWFKFGLGQLGNKGSEIITTLPKNDWAKPPEPETKSEQKEGEKPAEQKNDNKEPDKAKSEEQSKSLFSGEIKVGPFRSKYNLDMKQDKQSEEVGRQDMGAK